jgi:hypothetical protein
MHLTDDLNKEMRKEIGREIADMIESYNEEQIKLSAGEMTAQEMRTVKAVQSWWVSAIRHKCGVNL